MRITDIIKVVKNMGLPWVLFRTTYELKRRTGLLKRKFPAEVISDREFFGVINDDIKDKVGLAKQIRNNRERFMFSTCNLEVFHKYLDSNLTPEDKKKIIRIADRSISGEIYCFSRWTAEFGCPINWHRNPVTGYLWPKNQHWVDLEELSTKAGDVKYVWEASRFPQFYYLVRAYTLTRDEKYAQAYWEQIEHWIKENPYQYGINWKCGQEVAFRSFAWIFGLYAFLDSPLTTDERILMLVKNLYLNAIRIEKNIDFAIKAVRNNHAISEAAGLFTIGLLFPFVKDAPRMLHKGMKFLEQEGRKQIYQDGSYIQDSTNYHRLMLQVYTWCYRLARINGIEFSPKLTHRLKSAIDFLYQMQDETTGFVPNYGSNDGALIFPLSSCDYLDYRPQLNTVNYLINGKKLYRPGKHEEDLMWFCGLKAVNSHEISSRPRVTKGFKDGGYYLIRAEDSFGMIRCTKYKHRPGQADMLHFDLWCKGVNILTDIGSYSYNPEEKFRNYFSATRNHNTLTVDGKNQTIKGPRFLKIDWPKGFVNTFQQNAGQIRFSGYHTGYGVFIHTRKLELQDNRYIITDEIENPTGQEIKIRLNWNVGTDYEKLKPNKYYLAKNGKKLATLELSSLSSGNVQIYFGNEEIPAGWKSLYYGEKSPVNQLVYEIQSKENLETLKTVINL